MRRWSCSAVLAALLLAGTAWAKLRPDEQQYFDNQFRALLEISQVLQKQIQALKSDLAEISQAQAQSQETLARHQEALEELQKLVASVRASNDESLISLKTALAQMRAETQESLSALADRSTEVTAVAPGAASALASATVHGYVTLLEGNTVSIDQGSSRGLRVGSRLGLYKATEPRTRVGVLEVTYVLDAGHSRAKIVSVNAGVRPEFGDIVRLE